METVEGTATLELVVSGMHCQSCASLIEETLAASPGIAEATVDLEAARAVVRYRPDTASTEAVCAALARAGYTATPISAAS
jgi:copper chaperone CopZ